MSDIYVRLGRDLLDSVDAEQRAEFRGEWGPDGQPPGWETFRVFLHGAEAGDVAPATWEDLRKIAKAMLAVRSSLP